MESRGPCFTDFPWYQLRSLSGINRKLSTMLADYTELNKMASRTIQVPPHHSPPRLKG